jgi:DNA polymerase III delta prime subunit
MSIALPVSLSAAAQTKPLQSTMSFKPLQSTVSFKPLPIQSSSRRFSPLPISPTPSSIKQVTSTSSNPLLSPSSLPSHKFTTRVSAPIDVKESAVLSKAAAASKNPTASAAASAKLMMQFVGIKEPLHSSVIVVEKKNTTQKRKKADTTSNHVHDSTLTRSKKNCSGVENDSTVEFEIAECDAALSVQRGGVRLPVSWKSSTIVTHVDAAAPFIFDTRDDLENYDNAHVDGSELWEKQHADLPPMKRVMWDEALAPTSMIAMTGQSHAKREIQEWWGIMKTSAQPTVSSSILLHGPPGTGKSLLVHLCASYHGYRIVRPDLESGTKNAAVDEALGILKNMSLESAACSNARPIALLIEHLDDQDSRAREVALEIQRVWATKFRACAFPRNVLILSCEDVNEKSMRSFRTLSKTLQCVPLSTFEMKSALLAANARGKLDASKEDLDAVLGACSGRMRSALISLQFLSAGTRFDAVTGSRTLPWGMNIDVLQSANDAARAALSGSGKGGGSHVASLVAGSDIESTLLALHTALPTAAAIENAQVTRRQQTHGKGSRANAQSELESEALDALVSSYEALSHHDTAARLHWTELDAHMATDGIGKPVRELRSRIGNFAPIDHGAMGASWMMIPEYFLRKSQGNKLYNDGREAHETRTLKGWKGGDDGATSDKHGIRTLTLPPHIQCLDHIRPTRATLIDYECMFPRKWQSIKT